MKTVWLLAVWLFNSGLVAQESVFADSSILAIEQFLAKSSQDMARVEKTKDRLLKDQEELLKTVIELKEKQDLNPYERFLLKNALTEGEDLSKQIEKLDQLLAAYDTTNRERKSEMKSMMLRGLMREADLLLTRRGGLSPDSASDHLLAMLKEKERYDYPVPDMMISLQEIRIGFGDDADRALRKADVLMDQSDRLRRYLDQLEEYISSVRLSKALQDRLKRVAARFTYFGERWKAEPGFYRRLPLTKVLLSEAEDLDTIESKIGLEMEAALARIDRFEKTAGELVSLAAGMD